MEDDQLFSIAEKKKSLKYHNDYKRITYSFLGVSIKDNTIEREGKGIWSVEWILNTYLNYVSLSVIVSPNNSAKIYHGVLSRLLYFIRVGKTKDLTKINDLIDNICFDDLWFEEGCILEVLYRIKHFGIDPELYRTISKLEQKVLDNKKIIIAF